MLNLWSVIVDCYRQESRALLKNIIGTSLLKFAM